MGSVYRLTASLVYITIVLFRLPPVTMFSSYSNYTIHIQWGPGFNEYPSKKDKLKVLGEKNSVVRKTAETRQQNEETSCKKEPLSMSIQYQKGGCSGQWHINRNGQCHHLTAAVLPIRKAVSIDHPTRELTAKVFCT